MIKSITYIIDKIPITFKILIIIPANFSVLLTLASKTFLISLSVNSSKLTLNTLDNSLACLISGDVSPVSLS